MPASSRRFLPVLLVLTVVVGLASAVGAQVDGPAPRVVWAASCVAPDASELVVYGRGWASAPVSIEVADQAGTSVGGGSTPVATGRFQTRVALSVPSGASSLRVTAAQGGGPEKHDVSVSPPCSPTITAVAGSSCVAAGQPVVIDVTVRGAPASTFNRVIHHADLFGPAEIVNRSQPPRSTGDYALTLTAPNVPSRVVPVTVEAQRPKGGPPAYATTTVGLPPACPPPETSSTTAPKTSPVTTAPASSSTTAPPAGAVSTLLPSPAQPIPGGFATRPSLSLLPSLGQAGQAMTVVGTGFSPSANLTLRWRPGIGAWTVRVGGDGSFRTQVLVLPNDVEGRRSLEVVESPGGPAEPERVATTSASYLVVPASGQPAFGGVFLRG